jgi:hypothetical protein
MEDQPLVTTMSPDPHASTSAKSTTSTNDTYMSLRPCCAQCRRATDKGLQADWIPPISRSAQRKLDTERMTKPIQDIPHSSDHPEIIDEKTSSFVVDEVELLHRQKGSATETCGDRSVLDRLSPCRATSTAPNKGPVWLCSGRDRSPRSTSSSPQSPPGLTKNGGLTLDYFAIPTQQTDQDQRAAQADLDAKVAEALSAEVALARTSTQDAAVGVNDAPRHATTNVSDSTSARSPWFRGVVI